MKKILFFTTAILLFGCFASPVRSQQKAALPPDYRVDTRVDNMGYWRRMAAFGLVPVQPYSVIPRAEYKGSKIVSKGITYDDSPDVPVTTETSTQSENSVFVDPTNEQHVINSNNSTQYPNAYILYGANYFQSYDAGLTWSGQLEGTGGGNSGDPAVCINLTGRYFSGFIDNAYGQSIAYSDDQGATWTVVKVANKPPGYSDMLDKNHLWVDNSPTSPYNGYLYDAYTPFGGSNNSEIEVKVSTTNGTSWSSGIKISTAVNAGSHCQGVNLKTGPDGEAYAAFAIYDSWPSDEKAMGFAKSLDGGITWEPAIRAIDNIKGIRTSTVNKNHRVNSFPSMACDISNGPNRGNLYIIWPNKGVPGQNSGNDVDVYMIRSTDQGVTWSTPIRINQDPTGQGKKHYFPWINCDQANGMLSVVFYDDRDVSASQDEVWLAYSSDGGNTWADMRVSDVSFTPSPIPGLAQGYMGDYLGITGYDGMTYPTWTDTRLGHAMTYVSPLDLTPPINTAIIVYDNNILNDTTYGNGNGLMDNGETELLGLTMKNIGSLPGDSVQVLLTPESPFITMLDSTEFFGYFDAGQTKTILDAFKYQAAENIPNGAEIVFTVTTKDSKDSITISNFSITAHAPALRIISMNIVDPLGNNNGRLDPGETATLEILTKNTGEYALENIISDLSTDNPFVTITETSYAVGTLAAGESTNAIFEVTVSPYAYLGSAAVFHNDAYSTYYSDARDFLIKIGLIVEDWETGNFLKFAWQNDGTHNWVIVSDTVWEGNYAARSGAITGNEKSDLQIQYNVFFDDSISFYRKVSSEPVFDRLKFYIDTLMVGQWSGEELWSRVAFPVLAGPHTFKWEYEKNGSLDQGMDAAWIDYIVFPPEYKTAVTAGEDASICAGETHLLHGMAMNVDSVRWTSSGTGMFSDATILDPVYTPGEQDILAGSVNLIIHAYGLYASVSADSIILTIAARATADAGGADNICAGMTYETTKAVASNFNSLLWTTTGDGIFTNPTQLLASYMPGTLETQHGEARLLLTVIPASSLCPVVTDTLQLTIHQPPVVDLGTDTSVCANITYLLDATNPNIVSYLWLPSHATTPTLLVDSAGVGIGAKHIALQVTDLNGCTGTDSVVVTFKECAGISELQGISANIYPNPNNGIFTVELTSAGQETVSLRLLNGAGEQVYIVNDLKIAGTIRQIISVSLLPQGSYFLEIGKGKAKMVRKLVIQK